MTDRPILRFRNPRAIGRRPSGSRMVPKSLGLMPTIWRQGERLRARFDPIVAAFLGNAPTTELRRHPDDDLFRQAR